MPGNVPQAMLLSTITSGGLSAFSDLWSSASSASARAEWSSLRRVLPSAVAGLCAAMCAAVVLAMGVGMRVPEEARGSEGAPFAAPAFRALEMDE